VEIANSPLSRDAELEKLEAGAIHFRMKALMKPQTMHLVHVTPDHGRSQLWAAATSREEAVACVLNILPEGWCARLLDDTFASTDKSVPNVPKDEVWQLDRNATLN